MSANNKGVSHQRMNESNESFHRRRTLSMTQEQKRQKTKPQIIKYHYDTLTIAQIRNTIHMTSFNAFPENASFYLL